MKIIQRLSALAFVFAPMVGANAATVGWADWTSATPGLVTGTITAPTGTVGVTATGTYSFVQTTGGTNFWSPTAPYLSTDISNPPPAADIIALANGGTETVTFTQAVIDPLVALNSWNGNTVQFSAPIEVVSYGAGYWGNGTPIVNGTGDGFFGSGEVHGVIRLKGTFTSFSFTHTSENWHGFTVGITAVPEPDAAWLVLAGLPLLALRRRRRR